MSYLILGSGALGSALARELMARDETFLLAGRDYPKGLPVGSFFPLQEVDVISFDALFTTYDVDPLPSVVINTIGLLHDARSMPERRVEEVVPKWLCDSLLANAWPTLALAARLSRTMKDDHKVWLCAISDLAGSISANESGGRYSYRMSKAALDMGVKTLALEWAERFVQAGVIAIAPGLMDSPMNAPFLAELPADQLQDPAEVASKLLNLLDGLSLSQSGQLLDLDGQQLPW
ncbi:short-chain dehydrogenase [Aeromonas jandaei]|uniref:SDR family oxidoreductase n=1 Tax=Aeromonas jandaei TaxID=650 RepID=UPI00195008E9|nr:SDR family oxidoreductase [Aeromonas jandaei]BCS47476.1 short-chain dehydrogenase [Aeromonas jandaei]